MPVHLRDSHYAGAKRLGHGATTSTRTTLPTGVAAQDYLGVDREYYRPTDHGFEAKLIQRLAVIRETLRMGRNQKPQS